MVSPRKSPREFPHRRRLVSQSGENTSDFVVPPFNEVVHLSPRRKKNLSSIELVKRRRNATRALFPKKDSDDDETNRWLSELEDKHLAEQTEKWQFDFKKGRPLPDNSGEEGCKWTVTFPNEIPKFYTDTSAYDATRQSTSFSSSQPSLPTRGSPEKRRRSVSPRKSSAIVTRMASNTLLPPSDSAMLQCEPPALATPLRSTPISPRKAPRRREDLSGANQKASSNRTVRQLDFTEFADYVEVPPSTSRQCRNEGFAEPATYYDALPLPLMRKDGKKHAPKTPKEYHKTPRKKH